MCHPQGDAYNSSSTHTPLRLPQREQTSSVSSLHPASFKANTLRFALAICSASSNELGEALPKRGMDNLTGVGGNDTGVLESARAMEIQLGREEISDNM